MSLRGAAGIGQCGGELTGGPAPAERLHRVARALGWNRVAVARINSSGRRSRLGWWILWTGVTCWVLLVNAVFYYQLWDDGYWNDVRSFLDRLPGL